MFKQKSAICTFVIVVTKMSKLGNRVNYVPQLFELLPIREYHCDFQCGKVFKNRLPYEMHLQRVHGVVAQENDAYKCPVENCEYVGSRLNLLRRHFQSYHMEKNYHCQNCDKKFLLDSQYNKHKCDLREYGCPRCFKIFKLLSVRNRHVRICMKRSHVVPVQRVKNSMDIKLFHGDLDFDTTIYEDDVTIEEFEQLFRNIENKTIQDPELIRELARLTPLLESLQS